MEDISDNAEKEEENKTKTRQKFGCHEYSLRFN